MTMLEAAQSKIDKFVNPITFSKEPGLKQVCITRARIILFNPKNQHYTLVGGDHIIGPGHISGNIHGYGESALDAAVMLYEIKVLSENEFICFRDWYIKEHISVRKETELELFKAKAARLGYTLVKTVE